MIRELCAVDVGELARWIAAIPFSAWPQQAPGIPAMINDLRWCAFGERTGTLVAEVMARQLPRFAAANRMLSVVLPGADIPEHADPVPIGWQTRVHVPLQADAGAVFEIDGVSHHLEVGFAYSVDIRQPHAVYNRGAVPRIHLMWDVLAR